MSTFEKSFEDYTSRMLRLNDVKKLTGLSRSCIYKRMAVGAFPQRYDLGGRLVGWLETDIQSWINDRSVLSSRH